MSYQQTEKPKGFLYHYTTRDHLEDILRDGRIRRMGDRERWFCTSLEDTLELMQKTVMMEGKPYYGVGGVLRYYPVFVPESYVILRLQPRFQNWEWVRWNQELPLDAPTSLQEEAKRFSSLKVGFRGDLKFQEHPDIIELAPLLERQQRMGLKLTQS